MWRPLAILCLAAVNMLAAATEIRDTIYTGFSGVLFAGRMTIDSPAMTTGDGRTVQRWQRTYTITAGVISVDLEPNTTATPAGTSYYVVYRPTSGLAWSERWVVTVSATPLKVSEVRVATAPIPAVMIQPSQILGGAATTGQALLWSGSVWAPGGVLAASAVNALSAAVTTVKQARLYAVDYCTVPGTFDHTCITAAVAAAPANSVILLGKHAYSIGGSVSIASKTDLRIEGAGPSTVLTLANGVNAAVFAISDCTRCTIADVNIAGNKANQTVAADAVIISNSIGVRLENLSVTGAKGVCVSALRSPADSNIQDLFAFDGGSVEQCDGGGVKITALVQYTIRKVLFSLNGLKQLHTSAGARALADSNRFEFAATSTDNVVHFQTTTRPIFRDNYLKAVGSGYATRDNILFDLTNGGTLVGNCVESPGYLKLNAPAMSGASVFVVSGNGLGTDSGGWTVTTGTQVATNTGWGLPAVTANNTRHVSAVTCTGTTPIWHAFLPAGTSVTADCAEAANGVGGAGFPDGVGDQALIFKVPLYPPLMTGGWMALYLETYQTVTATGALSAWDGYVACANYGAVLNNLSWTKAASDSPKSLQQWGVPYSIYKHNAIQISPTEWAAAHCDTPSSAYALFKIVRHSNASSDKNTATVYVHGIDVSYASNQ